jgi:hypothetical protein
MENKPVSPAVQVTNHFKGLSTSLKMQVILCAFEELGKSEDLRRWLSPLMQRNIEAMEGEEKFHDFFIRHLNGEEPDCFDFAIPGFEDTIPKLKEISIRPVGLNGEVY